MLPSVRQVVLFKRRVSVDPILSIFADGTDGFYFDFSKTDRLFQSITGETPADDAGENIGQALEGHGWSGRTLAEQAASAAEVVTNGGFDADASWSKGTGITIAGGVLSFANVVGGNAAAQSITLVAGAVYRCTCQVSGYAGGTIIFRLRQGGGSLAAGTINANGTFTAYLTAPASANQIELIASGNGGNAAASLDSVSVKRVTGNHGLQATGAAQPKWQAGGLARFDGVDDYLASSLILNSTAFTLAAKVSLSGLTGASTVLLGCKDASTGRAAIRLNAGVLGGDVGSQDVATIQGGGDVRGTTFVASLVATGSVVTLYKNGLAIYSGAQAGGGASAVRAIHLGILNNDGASGGNFMSGDMFHALAIKKALTASEIQAITNQWGTI